MADKVFCKIANATLASGDNSTILPATARQGYKLWQAIVVPGANADVLTFKNGSTAQSIVGVTANGVSAILPFSDVPWAYADVGNALTVNSGTTTTKITLYYPQG
jgi:hypothetical protein